MNPYWFAPKRYGYGSGFPISWEGWVVLIGYVLILVGLSLAIRHRPAQLIAAIILPTLAFIVICARTTRGGWRWRWGEEQDRSDD